MHQNTKYACLTAGLVGSLTLAISLSATLWVILLGSIILAAGFSLLSKLERLWGPAAPEHYYYIIPMLVGPVVAGLVRNTEYALWVGAPVAAICALAVHYLIIKSPPFRHDPDEEFDREFHDHHSAR